MTNTEHIDQLMLRYGIKRIDAKELWRIAPNKEEVLRMILNNNAASSLEFGQPIIFLPGGTETWEDYAKALHEIGHIALGHRHGSLPFERIMQEQAAWEWAFDNARVDIINRSAWQMMASLGSYWDFFYDTFPDKKI